MSELQGGRYCPTATDREELFIRGPIPETIPTLATVPQPPPPSPPATSSPRTSPPATAPPATSRRPPATQPPATQPPATQAPAPEKTGTVHGCNTYGQNCDGNPIFRSVPQSYNEYFNTAKIEEVPNGTQLSARCWTTGTVVWNYAALHNPPDYGPDPYDSTIYFNVRASNGEWGFIPDTYFVRDKNGKMGLPHC